VGPRHGGFALVGDADADDLCGRYAGVKQHPARAGELAVPDVEGVVLDPSGSREMLGKLLLRAGAQPAVMVEQDGARAGGALVEGEDDLFHAQFPRATLRGLAGAPRGRIIRSEAGR
jgi:hypothetical protein